MRAAAALTAALLVTGCGIVQPGVPDWVANRLPLEDCGNGPVAADGPRADAAGACLLDAFRDGRGAEIVTTDRMATGAPLTSYVRVHENGTIEMFLNLGDDPFAPGAWERFRCDELVPSDPVREPGDGVFTLEGCEQLPVP